MEQNEFKKIPKGFQTIRNEIQMIPSGGKYRFLPWNCGLTTILPRFTTFLPQFTFFPCSKNSEKEQSELTGTILIGMVEKMTQDKLDFWSYMSFNELLHQGKKENIKGRIFNRKIPVFTNPFLIILWLILRSYLVLLTINEKWLFLIENESKNFLRLNSENFQNFIFSGNCNF